MQSENIDFFYPSNYLPRERFSILLPPPPIFYVRSRIITVFWREGWK
ncbi:hypothetical protein PUN28_017360 [Cardiocondyla obscurior]|uniref:Uncharacterized protein n=1 Tax=Cardiocondyla obscurior TaxID=286306 RepID=A0AAW2EQE4_9HYME